MENPATAQSPVTVVDVIDPTAWSLGVSTLKEELDQHSGCVSSLALRQALEAKGVKTARDVVVQLKFYDFTGNGDGQRVVPSFRWFTHAKSFYSEERFASFRQEEAQVAQVAQGETVVEEVATPHASPGAFPPGGSCARSAAWPPLPSPIDPLVRLDLAGVQ